MRANMKISDAVKWTGKSRATILRAAKNGKVSAKKDANGVWDIDASDLARVYEMKLPEEQGGEHLEHVRTSVHDASRTPQNEQGEQGGDQQFAIQNAALQAELIAANRMIEERGKTIEDLRTRLDKTEERYDAAQTKLTALLTNLRPATPEPSETPEAPPERPLVRRGYWLALAGVVAVLAALWLAWAGGVFPDALARQALLAIEAF